MRKSIGVILAAITLIAAASQAQAQTPSSQSKDSLGMIGAVGAGVMVDADSLNFGVFNAAGAAGSTDTDWYFVSSPVTATWIGPETDASGLPDLWRVVVYNDNDVNGNGENGWGLENPGGGQLAVKFTSLAKGNPSDTAQVRANVVSLWDSIESLPAGFQTWPTLAGWWSGERTYPTHFVVRVPKTGAAPGIYKTTAIFDLVFNVP